MFKMVPSKFNACFFLFLWKMQLKSRTKKAKQFPGNAVEKTFQLGNIVASFNSAKKSSHKWGSRQISALLLYAMSLLHKQS